MPPLGGPDLALSAEADKMLPVVNLLPIVNAASSKIAASRKVTVNFTVGLSLLIIKPIKCSLCALNTANQITV